MENLVIFETDMILSTTIPSSQKPQAELAVDSSLTGYFAAFSRDYLSKICSYNKVVISNFYAKK
jgi:hypothetical protein